MPINNEVDPTRPRFDYLYCRYVGPIGWPAPCFSVGLRDPFKGFTTPVWMRFHRVTPDLASVRSNLMSSDLADRVADGGGHLWIRLDVPTGVDGDKILESLLAEADTITNIAYKGLEPNPNQSPARGGRVRMICTRTERA
jgi:hypothetical protein